MKHIRIVAILLAGQACIGQGTMQGGEDTAPCMAANSSSALRKFKHSFQVLVTRVEDLARRSPANMPGALPAFYEAQIGECQNLKVLLEGFTESIRLARVDAYVWAQLDLWRRANELLEQVVILEQSAQTKLGHLQAMPLMQPLLR